MKKFGKIVLEYFEDANKNNLIEKDQIYNVRYLMGEINRRIGNVEKANKIFDEVISETKDDKNEEKIYQIAFQQRFSPKEDIG
ncbi:MAG: DUF2225 domain-containing protein [Candidatus Lokiarchaeota archaeon]|nr:DUF2225 domain-containing protein [Candidatus Lokiarchaeota archaeon]